MKYVIYAILAFVAALLFLPRTASSPIRNLPLLLLLLSLVLLSVLIRFFKYVVLMARTRRLLRQNKINVMHCRFLPWASRFHGHYSITFPYKGKTAQIILLSRKRKYQRYHFERIDLLEFYRANRVAFKSGKNAAKLTGLVEVNQVGKQRLKWDDKAELRVILFDKLPEDITDSTRKELLAAGARICASDVLILDWRTTSQKR